MTPFTTSKIAKFFEGRLQFLTRGEDHIAGDHISVRQLVKDKDKVSGLVDPGRGATKNKSKDVSYSVEVYFNADGPTIGKCSCPIGQLRCSHMAALLLWAQNLYSKTDFGQIWNRPSTKNLPKNTEIAHHWKPIESKAGLGSPMTKDDVNLMRTDCDDKKQFGLHFLLSPEILPPTIPLFLRTIEDWLSDEDFLKANDKISWLLDKIQLTEDQIRVITEKTVGQSKNPLWLKFRKFRVTASNFGSALKKIRSNSFPPSFWKQLFGSYHLDGVQAINYGKAHEDDGIASFEKYTGKKVLPTGICMHPNGTLGASSDGEVEGEDSTIEVKCPMKLKNVSSEDALADRSFYLYRDKDGEVKLKRDTDYWHQVQGTLHLTNKTNCYFVVWTPSWCQIIVIKRDDGWKTNLEELHNFYVNTYLSKLFDHLNK